MNKELMAKLKTKKGSIQMVGARTGNLRGTGEILSDHAGMRLGKSKSKWD